MSRKHKKSTEELREQRLKLNRKAKPTCRHNMIVAPLWPKHGENIGTLLRTCDALGACMAIPVNKMTSHVLAKGNTIGKDIVCIHPVSDPETWLRKMHADNWTIIGVELAHDAISLKELEPIYKRVIILLGHEVSGISNFAWDYMNSVVEIPMPFAYGSSLNVAVAGSLVMYKIAGLM